MTESSNTSDPLPINTDKAVTIYSNMCRGVMTSEEIILDFALNPNLNGRVLDEPIEVKGRVVVSFASAKRLMHLLNTMLVKHEEAFGEVVLDVNQRVKTKPAAN